MSSISLNLNSVFIRHSEVAVRQVGQEILLVPLRSDARQGMGLYTLNATAARLWDWADGEHTLQQCVDLLCQDYDVDSTQAQADLTALLKDLLGSELLVLC